MYKCVISYFMKRMIGIGVFVIGMPLFRLFIACDDKR